MKQFFRIFLGSMAAIWFSFLLLFVGGIVMMGVSMAAAMSGGKNAEIKNHSVLAIDLSAPIVDRPTPADLMAVLQGQDVESTALNHITSALRAAADDDKVDGVYIYCGGVSAGTAQLQAIVSALSEFKKSGKWVYAYGDDIAQADYVVASQADSVFVNPVGSVDIHGCAAVNMYFKRLLDNVGVEAQVVKVGTYKSAVEPFILDSMSAPAREQQQVYLSSIWGTLSGIIAEGRGMKPEQINAMADSLMAFRSADDAMKAGLVDACRYWHQVEDMLKAKTDRDKDDDIRFVSPEEYCSAVDIDKKLYGSGKIKIGVLYAVGDITVDGKDGIASDDLVPQILELADDDELDGLIIRVNSGGGSAFASEQIWEAVEQYKERTGKPVWASMGDYAASGGYYILCGADRIYAEATTLTGSIGIFGIIPSAYGLMHDKLGVNTSTVATNPGGMPPTIFHPMSPAQRNAMQGAIDRGYDLFTSRVAQGRKLSQDSVKVIAEGRVWDGLTAKKIGLVDKIGGLDAAVADMAAMLKANSYTVQEYPDINHKWWEELLKLDEMMEARVVERNFGPYRDVYRAAKAVERMSPVQARMEYMVIVN